MPGRILKESITHSDKIEALTDSQEVMFYRLLVVADDYGLFDARPSMLASKCFPLAADRSARPRKDARAGDSLITLSRDLAGLVTHDLVRMYEVGGRPFGAIVQWDQHQRMRNLRAKHPQPPDWQHFLNPPRIAADCGDSPPPAARAGAHTQPQNPNPNPNPKSNPNPNPSAPPASPTLPEWVDQQDWAAFDEMRKGKSKKGWTRRAQELVLLELGKLRDAGEDPSAVLQQSVRRGYTDVYRLDRRGNQNAPPPGVDRRTAKEDRMDRLSGESHGHRINGRGTTIEGAASRADAGAVRALPGDLRQPGDGDVGKRGPGKSARGMGD